MHIPRGDSLEGLLHSCEKKYFSCFSQVLIAQDIVTATGAEAEGHKHTIICFVINNHKGSFHRLLNKMNNRMGTCSLMLLAHVNSCSAF